MTLVSPLRVAFAGTPRFAVPPLEALLSSRHTVVGVLTQPDRPKGRGRQLTAGPVKQVALAHDLSIAQPQTLADEAGVGAVAALHPDVLVVVAYGRILPGAVLQLPRLGCINIHASLLPRWRGAAPIQRAIQAGDAVTGVTIMQMDEGLDTGGMLAVERIPIGPRDTSDSLHEVLANVGARALLEVLEGLAAQRLQAVAQPQLGVSYAHKIAKAEAQIDWQASAEGISRQVRAFSSWPVAETLFEGEALRIHDAHAPAAAPMAHPTPGTWLGLDPDSHALRVVCGSGVLHVTQVQRAGRKVVAAAEFVRSAGTATGHFG